jgi:hypothetical protein
MSGARGTAASAMVGAALATLLSACALPPPYAALTAHGTVRADSPELAAQASATLESVVPRLRALLPGTRELRPEIWIQEEPWAYLWQAPSSSMIAFSMARLGRIHMPPEADAAERALVVAHECVHVLLDASWRPLPAMLEEGLCELVASELVPGQAAAVRGRWHALAAMAMGGLDFQVQWSLQLPQGVPVSFGRLNVADLDLAAALAVDPTLPADAPVAWTYTMRGIGYVLVERIVRDRGYAGLHELVVRADGAPETRVPAPDAEEARAGIAARGGALVPMGELLAAARLDEDPATGQALARASIDADGLRAAVIAASQYLAPFVRREALVVGAALRAASGEGSGPDLDAALSAREFLRAGDPWLRLGADGPGVRLLDIPEFVEEYDRLPGDRGPEERSLVAQPPVE